MMFRPGTGEVILILVVLLLFFGAKRIPDMARYLGRGLNIARRELKEDVDGKAVDKTDSGNGNTTEENS
jgi:sec-independent protein translocase protein TatA